MKKSNGFTLIELLVVIAIVGLLATAVSVVFVEARNKAVISRGVRFSENIYRSLGYEAVGIWNMDEGSGVQVTDGSGYDNHCVINGATFTSETPNSILGNNQGFSSLSFDGINDYVDCGNDGSLNILGDLTLEAWIKPSNWSIRAGQGIITNGQYTFYHRGDWARDVYYFMVRISEGINIGDSSWYYWAGVKTTTQFKEGKWYHLVGVKEGNRLKIYVNGKKERENNSLIGYTPTDSGIIPLRIGAGSSPSQYQAGLIDNVRVYREALSSKKVKTLYEIGRK